MTDSSDEDSPVLSVKDGKISQELQNGKHFRCIINLNTTLCTKASDKKVHAYRKHKSSSDDDRDCRINHGKMNKNDKNSLRKRGTFKDKYLSKSKEKTKNHNSRERIIPMCFRKYCRHHHEHIKEKLRRISINDTKCTYSKEQRKETSEKNMKQTKSRVLLSPIPSSSLCSEDSVSYEDISSTSSFNTDTESYVKNMSNKCHHKRRKCHNKERKKQDSKLDTLIKRTKERERKLVEQWRYNKKLSCTAAPNDCTELNKASDDISIGSRSTLVLELYTPTSPICDLTSPPNDFQNSNEISQNNDYQNRNENFLTTNDIDDNSLDIIQNMKGALANHGYSPSSPPADYSPILSRGKTNYYSNTDFNDFCVKREPMQPELTEEAYSPTEAMNAIELNIGIIKPETEFACPSPPLHQDEIDVAEIYNKVKIKNEL